MDSVRGARSVGAVVRHGEGRLPQELALDGITRMEETNAYLRSRITSSAGAFRINICDTRLSNRPSIPASS